MVLFGPDVSRYQAGIDLARVAAEGHQFVLAKVSQGASSRDPQWPTHRDGARRAGLLLAGYHYVTTESPTAQAANCAVHLGDKAIPIALDWEAGGGGWANFMACLDAFRRAGLNVRLAYCPRWYWQQQGSPSMAAAALPLWSSRYPSTQPGTPAELYKAVGAANWAGYGGLSVALVQFSDRASVAGRAVDCNAYQGTRAQLAALLGTTGGDDMAQVPQDEWSRVRDAILAARDMWGGGTGERLSGEGMWMRSNVETRRAWEEVKAARTDLLKVQAMLTEIGARLTALEQK